MGVKMHFNAKGIFVALALLALNGCGGGGGGETTQPTQSGAFINSPTKGIKYTSLPSGLSGTTDEDGAFKYKAGDTVSFILDLGGEMIPIGSTTNPSASTSVLSLVLPNGGDPFVLAQLLETLDKSSVDGKMDVSGIALTAGPTLTAIKNALSSANISRTEISTIANGIQSYLNSVGLGSLKYGTSGVSLNEALTNLSKNKANQSLLETKIQALSYDGISTILDLRNKPAFTTWIIKSGSNIQFLSKFGVIGTNNSYDFKSPGVSIDDRYLGTYSLTNSNRTGNWIACESGLSGTVEIKSSNEKSFAFTYSNNGAQHTGSCPPSGNGQVTITGQMTFSVSRPLETGTVTGSFLAPLTLSDVKNKRILIVKGCNSGDDNLLTINTNGVASDSCGTNLNGSIWTAGPFENTLQFLDANGTKHYLGITRLDKNSGGGNLPIGSVGSVMDITSYNSTTQPNAISFKVMQ
jgi:hypothetical protein